MQTEKANQTEMPKQTSCTNSKCQPNCQKDIKRYQAVIKEKKKVQYAEERHNASNISKLSSFSSHTFSEVSTV